jgi:hypothetical protein
MLGFFILWLSNLILSFSKRYNRYIVVIFFFVFIVMIGYRDISVGSDTKNYENIFKAAERNGVSYIEPLYWVLNKLVVAFGGDLRMMMLVSAFVVLLFFYLATKKSSNILFSFFCIFSLYYLFYAMNIIRQIIAVAVIFYGYTFLERDKIKQFLFWVVIAMLFHVSAVLGLIALFIRKIKLSEMKILLGILGSALMGFVAIITRGSFLTIFLWKYGNYINKIKYIRSSFLAPVFLSIVLSVFFYIVYKTSTKNLRLSLWMKLFFIAVVFNNIFIFIELGLRVVMFFSVGEIMLFPLYIQKKNNHVKEKSVPLIMVAVYLGGILFTLLAIKSAIVRPYSNILFN